MPSLEGLLASIPGLGGYEAARQQNSAQSAQQLQQASGLMQLFQAAQAAQQKQKDLARQEQFRTELAAAGENPEAQLAIARKYGDPTAIMHFAGQSLDRQAALKQKMLDIQLQHQNKLEELKAAESERRITRQEADRRAAELRTELQNNLIQARKDMLGMAAALRPPRQEPAPSIKDIVDPNNPNQLISVDTRTYQPGGSLGSPGVIGVAGKEPTAAKREQQKEEGKRQISNVLDTLASKYDELEKMGAVISPKQPGVKNIYERAAASTPGQAVAGFLGTKAQAVRDQINNSKPLIMAALKQATGMSSQQMNSNMELQFYLQAASDPTKSIESNRAALAILDKTYGLGTGVTAKPEVIEALKKEAPKAQSSGQVKFLGFE